MKTFIVLLFIAFAGFTVQAQETQEISQPTTQEVIEDFSIDSIGVHHEFEGEIAGLDALAKLASLCQQAVPDTTFKLSKTTVSSSDDNPGVTTVSARCVFK